MHTIANVPLSESHHAHERLACHSCSCAVKSHFYSRDRALFWTSPPAHTHFAHAFAPRLHHEGTTPRLTVGCTTGRRTAQRSTPWPALATTSTACSWTSFQTGGSAAARRQHHRWTRHTSIVSQSAYSPLLDVTDCSVCLYMRPSPSCRYWLLSALVDAADGSERRLCAGRHCRTLLGSLMAQCADRWRHSMLVYQCAVNHCWLLPAKWCAHEDDDSC